MKKSKKGPEPSTAPTPRSIQMTFPFLLNERDRLLKQRRDVLFELKDIKAELDFFFSRPHLDPEGWAPEIDRLEKRDTELIWELERLNTDIFIIEE